METCLQKALRDGLDNDIADKIAKQVLEKREAIKYNVRKDIEPILQKRIMVNLEAEHNMRSLLPKYLEKHGIDKVDKNGNKVKSLSQKHFQDFMLEYGEGGITRIGLDTAQEAARESNLLELTGNLLKAKDKKLVLNWLQNKDRIYNQKSEDLIKFDENVTKEFAELSKKDKANIGITKDADAMHVAKQWYESQQKMIENYKTFLADNQDLKQLEGYEGKHIWQPHKLEDTGFDGYADDMAKITNVKESYGGENGKLSDLVLDATNLKNPSGHQDIVNRLKVGERSAYEKQTYDFSHQMQKIDKPLKKGETNENAFEQIKKQVHSLLHKDVLEPVRKIISTAEKNLNFSNHQKDELQKVIDFVEKKRHTSERYDDLVKNNFDAKRDMFLSGSDLNNGAPMTVYGMGKYAKQRKIHFNSVDDFFFANQKYGNSEGFYNRMSPVLETMSNEIERMKRFGATPKDTQDMVNDLAKELGIVGFKVETGNASRTDFKGQNKYSQNVADMLQLAYSGFHTPDTLLNRALNVIRKLNITLLLGKTITLNQGDALNQGAVAANWFGPAEASKIMGKAVLNNLNPANFFKAAGMGEAQTADLLAMGIGQEHLYGGLHDGFTKTLERFDRNNSIDKNRNWLVKKTAKAIDKLDVAVSNRQFQKIFQEMSLNGVNRKMAEGNALGLHVALTKKIIANDLDDITKAALKDAGVTDKMLDVFKDMTTDLQFAWNRGQKAISPSKAFDITDHVADGFIGDVRKYGLLQKEQLLKDARLKASKAKNEILQNNDVYESASKELHEAESTYKEAYRQELDYARREIHQKAQELITNYVNRTVNDITNKTRRQTNQYAGGTFTRSLLQFQMYNWQLLNNIISDTVRSNNLSTGVKIGTLGAFTVLTYLVEYQSKQIRNLLRGEGIESPTSTETLASMIGKIPVAGQVQSLAKQISGDYNEKKNPLEILFGATGSTAVNLGHIPIDIAKLSASENKSDSDKAKYDLYKRAKYFSMPANTIIGAATIATAEYLSKFRLDDYASNGYSRQLRYKADRRYRSHHEGKSKYIWKP